LVRVSPYQTMAPQKRARDGEGEAPTLHGLVCRLRVPAHLARRPVFGDDIARRRPRVALAEDTPPPGEAGGEWQWTFLVRLPPPPDEEAAACPYARLHAQRALCDALDRSLADLIADSIVDDLGGNLAFAGLSEHRDADLLVWWAGSPTSDGVVAFDVSDWHVMPGVGLRALPAVAALDRSERVRGALGALSETIEEVRDALTDGQYLALCDRARDVHRVASSAS